MQAWAEPWTGHIGTTWEQPELFLDMARSLERACFDYILIEDSSYVGESFGGSTEIYLKNAIAVPRQDPSVVAALMTQATSRRSASSRPSAPTPIIPICWPASSRRSTRCRAGASAGTRSPAAPTTRR